MANRITTLFDFKEQGRGLSKIKADVQGVDGAWNKAKTGFKSAATEFRNSNTAQAAAIGALGAAAFKAVGLASDLEESVNAVKVTFGDAADEILAIGDNSAESFGLSQSSFNQFAVQFSAFAQQIADQDGRKVSDVIEEMTTRTADFASVQNLDLARAGEIVMSTMAGETEAFRRYGGDVSAATIKTFAYKEGIAEAGAELTEGQKVLARYGAFMEQTDKVSGDFANTSDSLANSQRIAAARAEDLAAEFGEKLAPALEAAVTGGLALMDVIEAIHLDDLIGAMNKLDDASLSLGRNVRHIFDGGEAHKNREFADSANAAMAAVEQFDMALLDETKTAEEAKKVIDEYAAAVDDGTSNLDVGAVILAQWTGAQRDAAEAAEEAERAALLESEAMRDQARAADKTATVLGEVKRSAEEKARADEEAAEAAELHRQRIDELYEAGQRLVGGDIAVRDAQRQAAEAMAELTENATAQSAEVDRATEAQLNAASAAAEHRIQQAEASGETLTAKERAAIHREELQRVADKLNGPVKDALEVYLADLAAIPRHIDTTVRTEYRDVFHSEVRRDEARARNRPAFHDGGVVPGPIGVEVPILAKGGETVLPTHKRDSGVGGPLELGDDTIRKLAHHMMAAAGVGAARSEAQLLAELRRGVR